MPRLLVFTLLIAVSASCSRTGVQARRCVDDSECTSSEICEDNICTESDGVRAGDLPECIETQVINENNECVQCVVNADCDDGNPCNGPETCQGETCLPGNDPCLATPEQDICQLAENEAGYVCARVECVSDGECDGDTPFCDNGACVACLENVHCDDDVICNGAETCNENNECEAGDPVVCGDDDACNGEETCDDTTGECLDGTDPCLDTEALDICVSTVAEPGYECQEVVCLQDSDCGAEAPFCNANNICVGCMTDAHCDDSSACNGIETCNFSTGSCESGTPVVCEDADVCNGIETCDDLTGACLPGSDPCLATEALDVCEVADNASGYICQEVACLQNSDCDDDLGCTGVETCNENNTCESTGDPCALTTALDTCVETAAAPFYSCELIECLDNSDCTDAAAPFCGGSNTCVACLENAHCLDGDGCNGSETCSASNECVAGTDPCLDTAAIDICISTDAAGGYDCEEVSCINDDHCDDEDLCNGVETCHPDTYECVAGSDPIDCNDGDLCNGEETCTPSTGACVEGTPVCANGDVCEEDASSDDGYICLEIGLLQLQAGGDKTCGLSNTNDLFCWGSNLNGSLAPNEDGMGGYDEPTITYLTNATYIASDVQRVAVGRNDDGYGNHICYIQSSDEVDKVYCQGSQLFGMLGDGAVPDLADDFMNNYLGADYISTLPSQKYVDIAAGSAHTCVVSETGELYCWGFSAHGQTGGNSYYQEARPTPAWVSGFPAGSHVVSVAAGLLHTCVIVSDENDADPTDGDLYCFGSNQDKQLAQNTTTGTCDDIYTGMAIDCESTPKKVSFPGDRSVSQVCGGYNYTCAIVGEDETVYCWGDFYQTGIDAGFPSPIPEGTTNVKEIACGMRHACVLSNSGSVTCFGDYELYDSMWEEYTSVDAVADPLSMFPDQDASEVEHVAAGKKHSCYASSDPETNCWGYLNSSVIYDFSWLLLDP